MKKILTMPLMAFALLNLSGCIGVYSAVMSAVPVIYGTGVALEIGEKENAKKEGKINVIVDESTITEKLKQVLAESKKITFLSKNKPDYYAAEYLEMHGKYTVELQESLSLVSASQRTRLMKEQCQATNKPDTIFSFSEPETSKISDFGRVKTTMIETTYILLCKDNSEYKFVFTINSNQGKLSEKTASKFNRIVGIEYAKKIMHLAGKLPPISKKPEQ